MSSAAGTSNVSQGLRSPRRVIRYAGQTVTVSTLSMADFCRYYGPGSQIRDLLHTDGCETVGALLEISETALKQAHLKLGHINELKVSWPMALETIWRDFTAIPEGMASSDYAYAKVSELNESWFHLGIPMSDAEGSTNSECDLQACSVKSVFNDLLLRIDPVFWASQSRPDIQQLQVPRVHAQRPAAKIPAMNPRIPWLPESLCTSKEPAPKGNYRELSQGQPSWRKQSEQFLARDRVQDQMGDIGGWVQARPAPLIAQNTEVDQS
ncbi:hypothetical protein DFH09DRAFT_1090932 [Mycena vulgaris]|nr:hypothetical protein DFH09DRAFT_1090932 [Mycena vulgaris]